MVVKARQRTDGQTVSVIDSNHDHALTRCVCIPPRERSSSIYTYILGSLMYIYTYIHISIYSHIIVLTQEFARKLYILTNFALPSEYSSAGLHAGRGCICGGSLEKRAGTSGTR